MKIKDFVTQHYKHFNAAALVDAAKAYEEHIAENKKTILSQYLIMSYESFPLS